MTYTSERPSSSTLGGYMQEQKSKGRAKLCACETPGCSGSCAYAYGCHETRTGAAQSVPWGLVGFAILMIVGLLAWIL